MHTQWTCEVCTDSAAVEHEDDASLWEVAQAVLDAHRRAHPDCRGSAGSIRVRLAPKQAKEVMAQ